MCLPINGKVQQWQEDERQNEAVEDEDSGGDGLGSLEGVGEAFISTEKALHEPWVSGDTTLYMY